MATHTQESWYQTPNPLVIGHLHEDNPRDTPQVVAQMAVCRGHTEDGSVHGSPLETIGFDEAVANAARIVACVNNCQGIVNPGAVPLMLKALEDLKNIMVQIPDWELDIDIRTRVKAAMTAIATAEGRI